MQQTQPELDHQRCLDALEIAIRICKDQINAYTVRALKLTCKGLKHLADDVFLTSLSVSECFRDFERIPPDFEILTPALLKHVRDISIDLNWKKDAATIQNYVAGTRRILDLTSHKLRNLRINRGPVPVVAELIKGNVTWPNLQNLSLHTRGIARVKEELYSMRQLRSLLLNYLDSNKHDRKTLLSAPFLSNLTKLELFTSSSQNLTPLYMSKLFLRTKQLETLKIFGNLDFDYFGGILLEKLRDLDLHCLGTIDLAPLLAQPRPNLQSLMLIYDFLFNEELHDLIDSAKEVFPNLTCLLLCQSSSNYDEDQDWSCLERIDLPNLTELYLSIGFREIVGIVQPTAKLPKLRSLSVGIGFPVGHPRDWEENAEQIFSSPLLHQLEKLIIHNSYFRLGSLAILCKYATQLKMLETLEVHCYDMAGVRMIADAGELGGFPNLKTIVFYDMDPGFDVRIDWVNGEQYFYPMEWFLRPVWPNIKYFCWSGSEDEMEKYGQPNEFAEVDEIEGLQELHIAEVDNDENGA